MTGSLQRELKKKQPFASVEQEAILNLLRTSDRVQIQFERLFREHGLTHSQYNVLRILRGEGKPTPILEVAARTIAVVPAITGLIDRLERAGMVERRRCVKDRRVIFVEITGTGRKRLAVLDEPLASLEQRLVGHLTQAELQELIRLLEKVRLPLGEEQTG